jgi:hypothetical protein
MPDPTYARFLKEGVLINKSMEVNKEELVHMEPLRERFDVILTRVQDLTAQQAQLTASKQEVSKQLALSVNEGRKMLTFLKTGVKQHFGNRSEKLSEFGIQPFRSRPRVRLVGPDGKPLRREDLRGNSADQEPNG